MLAVLVCHITMDAFTSDLAIADGAGTGLAVAKAAAKVGAKRGVRANGVATHGAKGVPKSKAKATRVIGSAVPAKKPYCPDKPPKLTVLKSCLKKRPAAAPSSTAIVAVAKKPAAAAAATDDDDNDDECPVEPTNTKFRDRMKSRKFDSIWDDLPEWLQETYTQANIMIVISIIDQHVGVQLQL